MKFKIRYALSGGFGGCENEDWEEIDADDLDEANTIAYQASCELYECYVDREVSEIMEEDEVDEDEAESIFNEERERWIEYEAEEVK